MENVFAFTQESRMSIRKENAGGEKKRILAFLAWMKEFQLNRLFSGKSDGKWVI